VTQYRRIYMR